MTFVTTSINLGAAANDNTGTKLRNGGDIINDNFADIVSKAAEKSKVLQIDNTTPYTPSADYHPATKKYVDDHSGGGGTSDGGFADEWTLLSVSGSGTPSSGGFITNTATSNSITQIILHKNSANANGFNNAVEDVKFIMIANAAGSKTVFEVKTIVDSSTYVTLGVDTVGGSLGTITTATKYIFSFLGTLVYVKSITAGNGLTGGGSGTAAINVGSSPTIAVSTDSIYVNDESITTDQLDCGGAGTSGQVLKSNGDGSMYWSSAGSGTAVISGESIVGNGSTTAFNFSPSVTAYSGVPIVMLYDYTDSKNVRLGKFIGVGTAEVWVEMNEPNDGDFRIVFGTAPASGKTYAVTYIC